MSISSTPAAEKAAHEVRVFKEFVGKSGLPIDPATVESREPPEPDIRCVHSGWGDVAFELVELCNPELAKDIADQRKRGAKPGFHWVNDPSEEAFRGKLAKSYRTDVTIELLCYTGRTGVPDDMSLATLRELANTHGIGPFRRVWFLGEKTCEMVAELGGHAFKTMRLSSSSRLWGRPRAVRAAIGDQVGVLRHPCCRIKPDLMPGPLRHNERDAPPMRERSAGVGCPVGQDHIALALASLSVGFDALVAAKSLGVDLRQPCGVSTASGPSEHLASPACASTRTALPTSFAPRPDCCIVRRHAQPLQRNQGQSAIRDLFSVKHECAGNLPPLPENYGDALLNPDLLALLRDHSEPV